MSRVYLAQWWGITQEIIRLHVTIWLQCREAAFRHNQLSNLFLFTVNKSIKCKFPEASAIMKWMQSVIARYRRKKKVHPSIHPVPLGVVTESMHKEGSNRLNPSVFSDQFSWRNVCSATSSLKFLNTPEGLQKFLFHLNPFICTFNNFFFRGESYISHHIAGCTKRHQLAWRSQSATFVRLTSSTFPVMNWWHASHWTPKWIW